MANGKEGVLLRYEQDPEPTPEVKKAIRPMRPQIDFDLAEFKTNKFEGTITGCDSPQSALLADYWQNLSGMMRRFDRANLRDAAGRWWASYLCVESELGFVKVMLIHALELPPLSPVGESRCPPGWVIEPGGADRGGYVGVRVDAKSGRRAVVDKAGIPFTHREDCLRAIMDHASNRQSWQ